MAAAAAADIHKGDVGESHMEEVVQILQMKIEVVVMMVANELFVDVVTSVDQVVVAVDGTYVQGN